MAYLVISGSLNPESRSRAIARAAVRYLEQRGEEAGWLDLRDLALPLCDGAYAYSDPTVAAIKARIADADAIIFAVPVYNFGVNAAAKNLVELTGDAWRMQTVSFLCAAGGRGSYMAVMGFANSLMLDFRCLIVPRFLYALETDIENGQIHDTNLMARLEETVRMTIQLARALKPIPEQTDV